MTYGHTRSETLLDLGCGDGNHIEYLSKYTKRYYGSDYNLLRLVRAGSRQVDIPVSFFLADITDYPVQDGFFDVVFFNHVLEHIPDDLAALHSVYRILKPGGLLILGTPNEGASCWQLAYRLQAGKKRSTDNVHFYTAAELAQKVAKVGFLIGEVEWLGWGIPHWTLDAFLRQFRLIDEGFEAVGKRWFKEQASSLYMLAIKEP